MPHLINANEVSRSAIYRTAKSAGMSMTTSGIMHRTVEANGIHLHIAEQGDGPVVVLCHGFPETVIGSC